MDLQVWVSKSQLPGDSVAAGAFENAMRVSPCPYYDSLYTTINYNLDCAEYCV